MFSDADYVLKMENTADLAVVNVEAAAVEEAVESPDVEIVNFSLCSLVSQIVEYLLRVLVKSKRGTNKSSTIFVKMGSQAVEDTDKMWCTLKVGSKDVQPVQIQMEDFLEGCDDQAVSMLKEMQSQFGGEHLWCEFPDGSGTCQRMQWKIGPPGTRPECTLQARQKQINSCAVCFRVLQEKQHVDEEMRFTTNYLWKLAVVHPQVHLKFSLPTVTTDFGPKVPKMCLGQKRMLCDISLFKRTGEDSPTSAKISPRCGSGYLMQLLNVGDRRVQLKTVAVAALVPPRPIETALLNHTVKKLQVILYGPDDVPVSCSRTTQLGVCPTTLLNLEEYGLRIGEQIHEQNQRGQGRIRFDWTYRLELTDEGETNEELDSSQDQTDFVSLLVCLFISVAEKDKYSTVETMSIMEHLRKNFAQVMCKNSVKIRKAVGTALNKILRNFSALDQKQKMLETSIPVIASSLASIAMHSTNTPFRQSAFDLLQVSDSREYNRAMRSSLWKVAFERYGIRREGNENTQEAESTTPQPEASAPSQSSSTAPTQTHDQNVTSVSRQSGAVNVAATTGIADVPDTTLQPVTNPVDLSDFDELGVIPHSSPVEQTVMPDLPAPEAVQPPVRSCAPSISGHQQPNKPNSSGVRRSLSKEFASHPATRTESNRALRELQPGNTQQLDPASTSVLDNSLALQNHFELLGNDQVGEIASDFIRHSAENCNLARPEELTSSQSLAHNSDNQLEEHLDWWDQPMWV